MLDMPKKPHSSAETTPQAGKRPGRPKTGRKPAYTIYARIRPSLGDKVEAYLENTKPKTTLTGFLELALERFFEAEDKHRDA